MKYIRLVSIIFILILVSSCTHRSEKNTDQEGIEPGITDELQQKIAQLNAKLVKVEQENKRLKKEIDDYELAIYEQKETDYNNSLKDYYYKENDMQTLLGYRYYNSEEPLRAFPYSDSIEVNRAYPSDVRVISTVTNSYNEIWALIEFYGHSIDGSNNYGFVKSDYIETKELKQDNNSNYQIPINIQEISIGDSLEKAKSILGLDYIEMKGFERAAGGFIRYIKTSESNDIVKDGLDIFYELQTHRIWGIRLNISGYLITGEYGIGSNAMSAIEYFKSQYPMNGEVHFEKNAKGYKTLESTVGYWSFDVGSNYVLKFEIDTEELSDNSVITEIQLMPIWRFFV